MRIVFDRADRERYYRLLDEVFDSGFLSEGRMTARFEDAFGRLLGLHACAVTNGGQALLGLLEYAGVRGKDVVVPTNTFMATPLAVQRAGGRVVFADSNRADLCLSVEDLERRLTPRTGAVIVVHVGGHIAFDTPAIADLCRSRGIPLLEDCAHAHGAAFHGRVAGSFGLAGAYSFYATKTSTTGEGGCIVSRDPDIAAWARVWRNYGKPDYARPGFNARINEVTAALGIVQLERLPRILEWKRRLARKYDQIFPDRVVLPEGMESGYYKYITFGGPLREETGKVYDELCHEIMGNAETYPNAAWIKAHHHCPPIWYGWPHADEPAPAIAETLGVAAPGRAGDRPGR